MTDYTPTTDEVREYYGYGTFENGEDIAQFDNWLQAHNAEIWEQGAQAVRDRMEEFNDRAMDDPINPYLHADDPESEPPC